MPNRLEWANGVWLVINEDGKRYELPIELPKADYDEVLAEVKAAVAYRVRELDGPGIWQRCLAAADMLTDPVELFLEAIAETIEDL